MLAILLTGCAGITTQQALDDASAWAQRAGAPPPVLAIDDDTRRQLAAERTRLLQGELDEAAAVNLALRGSPAAQALLADGWSVQAQTALAGSGPRLGLAYERSVHGDEIARKPSVAFGLVELLTWPARHAQAQRLQATQRLALAQELLSLQTKVRQQWVRAVAAGERLAVHEQLLTVAEAGEALATRMQKAGNFSPLQQAREHSAAADARSLRTAAALASTQEREALVRLMGLDDVQAATLRWPARLPDLPAQPRALPPLGDDAASQRLDLALAQARLNAARQGRGPAMAAAITGELHLARERTAGEPTERSTEIGIGLPMPGEWTARRQVADAATLAAEHQMAQALVAARSTLRERHAAYLAAHGHARQFRDEVVPLRKRITDEMLLRYNGMLASVFALLADARAQVTAVAGAIDAQRDFWMANAALDAAVLGVGSADTAPGLAMPAAASAAPGGH